MIYRQDGFKNQRAIILPAMVGTDLKNNRITKLLFVTDIGFYSVAHSHYRHREEGSEQYILIYCVDGIGWVEIPEERKEIHANMFFIIPARMAHKYGASQKNPWTIYWLHFSGSCIQGLFGEKFICSEISNSVEANSHRIKIFEEIYYNLSLGFGTENIEYASTCLWHLLGAFKYASSSHQQIVATDQDIIETTISYMREHLHEKITLETFAKLVNRSASHYSLVFKNRTSKSPIEYFNYLKIQRASQLLDFTSLPVHEIGERLAFDDPFYFSRLFKKIMGMSPSKYRMMEKG
ncbi:MAG TPA: AraC family transcriptional regulator [Cytophagaceae bacterium]|jgi:AraC-like DNA-binding protein/mannose-6-phosphate isomerase-like protein (cupin superfamily)